MKLDAASKSFPLVQDLTLIRNTFLSKTLFYFTVNVNVNVKINVNKNERTNERTNEQTKNRNGVRKPKIDTRVLTKTLFF